MMSHLIKNLRSLLIQLFSSLVVKELNNGNDFLSNSRLYAYNIMFFRFYSGTEKTFITFCMFFLASKSRLGKRNLHTPPPPNQPLPIPHPKDVIIHLNINFAVRSFKLQRFYDKTMYLSISSLFNPLNPSDEND